ncbi:MAG: hypothetical protein GXP44_01420 [bacterium]|nr:hypothetical protein [bacterium]
MNKKNNKKKEGEVTINELAIMVANGFENITNTMNRRFEQVDKRFEQIDQRFEQVDQRFEQMNTRFDILEERVENGFAGLWEEIRKIWTKLDDIEEKIERVSQMAKEDIDAMAGGDVIDLRQRVEFLETRVKELQTA